MANDTVTQIDHSALIRPIGTHPQNIDTNRRKKKKREKNDRQAYKKQKDKVTIKGFSETSEDKKNKTPATDNALARKNKIDIRI